MDSYYEGKPFINIPYIVDIVMENHFKGVLFPDEADLSRIIYSSNEFAFRKRAKYQVNNNFNLPFLNYRLSGYDDNIGARPTWWNNTANAIGVYVKEIEEKLHCSPLKLDYECTFWCNRDEEMRYAFNELRWDCDNQTLLKGLVQIGGEDIGFPVHLGYNGVKIEPTYAEREWLEYNKIHSIALDFEIVTWNIKVNITKALNDWCIPETLLFDGRGLH